ncbi:Smr domain-containing protein [Yarrowia sp. B02]|nr:Smr domain-containing protein [Yarrowia sp. B02]
MSAQTERRIIGDDYNHATDGEYKKLRDMAHKEYERRKELSQKSQQAYKSGDGAGAKQLSEEAKKHGEKMDQYNRQAAEYVFRENNTDSAHDEIDLHGLYVEEAEEFLGQRIQAAMQRGDPVVKAIVGKGLHSAGGVAKIKPAVEKLCNQHRLRHHIDPKNSGVMIIELPNGPQQPGQVYQQPGPQQQPHYQQQQHQNNYQGQGNQYHQQQQQGQGKNDNLLVNILCFCINKFLK